MRRKIIRSGARLDIRRPFDSLPELEYLCRDSIARAMPGLAAHVHRGPVMEITYFERGQVHWWAGDEIHRVTGGHVYITWPGEIHGGLNGFIEPCKLYWLGLMLRGDAGKQAGHGAFLNLPGSEARHLVSGLRSLPRRCFSVPPGLARAFARLVELGSQKPNPARRLWSRNLLTEILLTVVEHGQKAGEHGLSILVREGMRLIRRNLASPLSLPDLARKLGWDLTYVKRQFRKQTGMPRAEYQLRLRIARACRVLKKGDASVTRVAADLGFSTSQHFITVFTKFTGLTPLAYRKSAGARRSGRDKKASIFHV